jgi:transposase
MQDVSAASVYLGVDAHSETCTFCAVDQKGEIIMRCTVSTDTRQLRVAVRELPDHTWAMIEASSVSIFVRDALASVLERVIICETRENRLISKSNDKSDDKDAHRLARLLRYGEFKEVYVPSRSWQEIRELIHVYQKVVGDVVRTKNRIRAKYARYGVRITASAYGDGRHDALKQLNRPRLKPVFDAMYGILDTAEKAKDDLDHALRARLSHTKEYKLLKTIPGVGPICAAIIVAIIVHPDRFTHKQRLWSYAGIGASEDSTGKTVKVKRNKHYNRLLKYAAMMAAQGAIRGDNRFARLYQTLLEKYEDPKKPKKAAAKARKMVARGILAAALAMWKTGTAYSENTLAKSA